jgi:hypothetical protein
MARCWLVGVALGAAASPFARSSPDDIDSFATPVHRAGLSRDDSGCCGPAGLVCDGPHFTGVVEETLFFAHPSGTFGWGNHDMADNLGEAVR